MTLEKNRLVFALMIAVSVLAGLAVVIQMQPQISAQGDDERQQYVRGNDVSIHTEFLFRNSVETSDGFQIFQQSSGFDRSADSPSFRLIGAVDYDRVHLYKAADMTYHRGLGTVQHDYGQFDANVYLQKDGVTFRHFEYSDCRIIDYKVDTMSDKEEGWTTSKGFTTVDKFDFECNGYAPHNPLIDSADASDADIDLQNSSAGLRDTQTWTDEFRR